MPWIETVLRQRPPYNLFPIQALSIIRGAICRQKPGQSYCASKPNQPIRKEPQGRHGVIPSPSLTTQPAIRPLQPDARPAPLLPMQLTHALCCHKLAGAIPSYPASPLPFAFRCRRMAAACLPILPAYSLCYGLGLPDAGRRHRARRRSGLLRPEESLNAWEGTS